MGFNTTHMLWLHWVLQALYYNLPCVLHVASAHKWTCTWNNIQSVETWCEWPVVQCEVLLSSYHTEVKTSSLWMKGKVLSLPKSHQYKLCKRNFTEEKIRFMLRAIHPLNNVSITSKWLKKLLQSVIQLCSSSKLSIIFNRVHNLMILELWETRTSRIIRDNNVPWFKM